MNIFARLSLLFSLIIFFIGLPVFTTFYSMDHYRGHLEDINQAGRQRMLSQKMTKELLIYLRGDLSASQNAFETSLLFDKVHKDLLAAAMSRNATFIGDDGLHARILSQMILVDKIWKDISKSLFEAIDRQDDDVVRYASIERVLVLNNELLEEMNRAVSLYEEEGKLEFNDLKTMQILCLIAAVFAVLVAFLYTYWQI